MDQRTRKLILSLYNSSKAITSVELAEQLNCSTRTVKSMVKEVRERFHDLIISSKKGYYLNSKVLLSLKSQGKMNEVDTLTPSQRKKYILYQLIRGTESLSLDSLCEDIFFCSESTLRNDLREINLDLAPYHISCLIENRKLVLQGNTLQIAALLSITLQKSLYEQEIVHSGMMEFFQSFLQFQADFHRLLEKNRLQVDYYVDISVTCIAFSYLVSLLHSKDKEHYMPRYQSTLESPSLKNFINQLLDQSDYLLVRPLEESEKKTLLYILAAYNIHNPSEVKEKYGKIPSLLKEISKEVVRKIGDYGVTFLPHSEERLSLHLQSIMDRQRLIFVDFQPIFDRTQATEPELFEMGVKAARLIVTRLGIDCNRFELGYLAYFIHSLIRERDRRYDVPVRFINEYEKNEDFSKPENRYLLKSIQLYTRDFKVLPVENDLEPDFSGLLLTTQPLLLNYPCMVRHISPYFNENDLNLIQGALYEADQIHNSRQIERDIQAWLPPNRYYYSEAEFTETQAINLLSHTLEEDGLVQPGFDLAVRSREAMAPTSYNWYSLLRAFENPGGKTGLAILNLKHPIQWSDTRQSKVSFVCLLSVATEDKDKFFPAIHNWTRFFERLPENYFKDAHSYPSFLAMVNKFVAFWK